MEDVLAFIAENPVLGVDTETTGLDFIDEKVIMFQIGNAEHQYIIDTRGISIEPLREYLESRETLKIFHNAKFDLNFIRSSFGIECENVHDTMLCEQILHCGRKSKRYNLPAVLKDYVGVEMVKGVRIEFLSIGSNPYTLNQIVYGALDVQHLNTIYTKQMELVEQHHLGNVVKLENNCVHALADMEYNGMGLNTEAWLKNSETSKENLEASLAELDNFIQVDETFAEFKMNYFQSDFFLAVEEIRKTELKWSSPKQVLEVLRKVLPDLENVNGKELLVYAHKHDIIKKYIKYKEYSKLYSSYGPTFLKHIRSDNHIHTSFKQILETGRTSSRNPNMQQIPGNNLYRNCFEPKQSDYVFVSADYSSQELCIIAHGSQDPVWLEALSKGQDLHSICAHLVYGKKWEDAADLTCNFFAQGKDGEMNQAKCDCKKHGKLRKGIKAINFGLAYGAGATSIADQLQIEEKAAEKLIKDYFKTFPSIKKFLTNLGNQGKAQGYIRTMSPYFRLRWFENHADYLAGNFREGGVIERASKNTPIQGTGSDMVKEALILVRRHIKDNDLPVKIVMVVHDQIDTIVQKDYAEEWEGELQALMERAALTIIPNGMLKADPQSSRVWEK
jgi:DNA polymerase I-like protein with 3'-5' exonuclease and polymerase domains